LQAFSEANALDGEITLHEFPFLGQCDDIAALLENDTQRAGQLLCDLYRQLAPAAGADAREVRLPSHPGRAD